MMRSIKNDQSGLKRIEHVTPRRCSLLSVWLFGAAIICLCAFGTKMAQAADVSFNEDQKLVRAQLYNSEDIYFKIDIVYAGQWGAIYDDQGNLTELIPEEDTDGLYYQVNNTGEVDESAWDDGLHAEIDKVDEIRVYGDDLVDLEGKGNFIDGSRMDIEEAPEMTVYAGDGLDEIYGGAGDDTLYGQGGNDIINGGDGDDEINGGTDNDLLRGDKGNDTLSGGGGWDVIDYSTDVGPGGIEVNLQANEIADGWGEDTIAEHAIFQAVRGSIRDDILVGYTSRSTTILGGGGNDTIVGGEQADVLFGDDGNDHIYGSGKTDFIFGGPGDDVIDADSAIVPGGDGTLIITEDPGHDRICGDGDPSPYWHPFINPDTLKSDEVEPVNGSAMIPPTKVIDFGGNDKIKGGKGYDRIYGGSGDDLINGDEDWDMLYGDFDYSDSTNFPYGDPGTLTGGTDVIRGGSGDDEIFPGAGSDTASGGDGVDHIYGSVGYDVIVGGEIQVDGQGYGVFVLYPIQVSVDNSPADWVEYKNVPLASTGWGTGVTVVLSSGNLPPGWAHDGELLVQNDPTSYSSDTIYGIENIRGSENNDNLTGTDLVGDDWTRMFNAGFDNKIVGRGGDDKIYGGLGDDELLGQWGDDDIWGDGGTQFEGGDDVLDGGSGNDKLHGEGGDDILQGGPGDDTISGGAGVDILDYYTFTDTGIVLDLSGATEGLATNDGEGGTDTILNCDPEAGAPVVCSAGSGNEFYARIEIVWGSAYSDVITGYTNWPTEIRGASGDDIITGGNADDLLDGQWGNDTIEGGLGDDMLIGGEDANGLDADTVTYANAPGAVTVNLGISGPQETSATGSDTVLEFENLIGSIYDDKLIGDAGANVITGGDGNDILNGRGDQDLPFNGMTVKREDTLNGGDGSDSADYRSGDPATIDAPDLNHVLNDGEGGSDILQNIEAILLPNNSLYVTAGPDWTISPGGSVKLQGAATGGSGNYSYVWDTVPPAKPEPGQAICDVKVHGLDDRCIAQPTASPEKTTTYRLTVTDYDAATGSMVVVNSNYVKVMVADTLIVDAGPDMTISSGNSIQMSASVSGGITPYTIAWSPSTGLSKTDILLPTASPNDTTTYTLTVTDQTGQEVSDTVTISVTNPYTVNAGADVTIAQGQSTQLNAVVQGGTSPYTYEWTPALGLSSTTIANPVASPTAMQTAYTVKVTDSTGRIASDTVIVSVTGTSDGQQQSTGGDTDGDTGPTQQPQSSSTGTKSGTTAAPTFSLPFCGAGVSQALVLTNLLLLVSVYRRRR